MGNLGVKIFWSENMNYNINYYVEKYVLYCSQLCRDEDDYTKEKVKKHNQAMKSLNKLKEEIGIDIQLKNSVYSMLLNNSDIYVQQSAATDCLNNDIHITESLKILKRISNSRDRMASMEAKRILRIWKGEISPDDPF